MLATKTKKVAVSSKRQIAIPKEFFDAIGIEKEIIMELNDGVISIKPVRTHTDDFSEEILADVIQEGFTGNDILKEFQRRKNMIRPAISQMIKEATSTKPTSIDDLFGDDDEDWFELNDKVPILFHPAAKKYFEKLKKKDKQLSELYKVNLQKIVNNPEIGEFKTGDLAGIRGYDFRHKGTVYEIAYSIEMGDNGELIVVILAGTRENFYHELKRYLKSK